MRDYALASATAAILAPFATSCDDVAPETVVRAEPAEAASIDSRMGPLLATQAEGNAVVQEKATVIFVIDGDTVDVALADEVVERVRLPQVDTPEADECGNEESTTVLEELIAGENVTLISMEAGPDRDTYGRLLRAVEINGDDVGQFLIRNGFARWVGAYAHEDSRLAAMYEAAESRAREESAGFWSTCGW
jgi:endonuclease YncB( thermonuclease family)